MNGPAVRFFVKRAALIASVQKPVSEGVLS
jgi:hypothetical protein